MKTQLIFILFMTAFFGASAQEELSQTIRGRIVDSDSKTALIGAAVRIVDSDPIQGAISDVNGNFRIDNVRPGRLTLQLTYLGYESLTIPNVLVNSGKEVVLDFQMLESTIKMEEIIISANQSKGEVINEMTLVSARSISPEETSRYPGGFNDPSRIMSNFAGISNSQDGSNDIIVRGNSPKYVQWRLEGTQITNPNHFAEQTASMGGVSALNNNLLTASDFHTGAFSPEFGNVLSGVYDIKLRAGNNEKFESMVGVGLIGTDLTLEGPLKKGYGGSYLANYRYSTVSIIQDLGLVDITGVPKFQDGAFKIVLPSKSIGTFSLFGLAGKSVMNLTDITPAFWETPGDRSLKSEIIEDINKSSHLINTGLSHILPFSKNGYLSSSFTYSSEGINDQVYETLINTEYVSDLPEGDSIIYREMNFAGKQKRSTYRGSLSFHQKLNSKNKLEVGSKYSLFDINFNQSHFITSPSDRSTLVDLNRSISTINNYLSWKHRVNDQVTIVSGFHNMNVLFNNMSTIEPRIAMNWIVTPTSTLKAGYGKHSAMESIHNYFAKVTLADGSQVEPNRNLGLMKADHFVFGMDQNLGRNMKGNVEFYYQGLYDLPVANNDSSIYSSVNEGLDFQYVDLVNKGRGRNYGIEMTLERFFHNNYYFLLNGSLYESKYTALDGIERNTRFNGNYLFNAIYGKEFTKLGKKQNQTLTVNGKFFIGGAQKIIPLNRDENGDIAVNPSSSDFWDFDRAYETGLDDPYMIIISSSYKWDKPDATHELFLSLENITNSKGKLSEFYDEDEPGSVGYLTQFGFFPNLMYRVYF